MATRRVTWAHVPTHTPSTPQQAIFAPRENSSDGEESEEGQAPSPAVRSRPTSSRTTGPARRATSGVTAPTTFSCTTAWALVIAWVT